MKQSTRQYAAQQTSAIRNNLLPIIKASNKSGGANVPLLYMLDATSEFIPLACLETSIANLICGLYRRGFNQVGRERISASQKYYQRLCQCPFALMSH
jgi:hypothetical protein